MDFFEALERLGFKQSQQRLSRGVRMYANPANRFLTYWVHVYDDGSTLLTWEFAIADYLMEQGIQLGSSEALNLYMFPARDERGTSDPGWLARALDSAETTLRNISFADPGPAG